MIGALLSQPVLQMDPSAGLCHCLAVQYKCSGAFSAYDGPGAGWFKIDQMGMTVFVYKNLK